MGSRTLGSEPARLAGQRTPDAYEGVKSFLEKRPPRFAMKPSTDMPDFFPWWKTRKFKE